jgi:hypothetical protein
MNPTYFSVDLEFTSGDVVHGQVMQLGVVCENGKCFSTLFPVTTKAHVNDWVKENLKELLGACIDLALYSSSTLPPLQDRRGKKVDAVLYNSVSMLQEFVLENTPSKHVAVFVAYCGTYDWAFTDKLFNLCGLTNPFHYEMLDISSFALGVLKLPWGFEEKEMLEILEMEPNPNKHNAMADAEFQLEIFNRLRNYQEVERLFKRGGT